MKGAKRTKKIYFIDTNIFVRTVVENEDAKQLQESKTFLEMVRSGRIKAATSSLILAEMSWVLGSAYKLTKKEILPYSAGIVNLRNLTFDDTVKPVQALRFWATYSIKFVDCLIASNPHITRGEMIIVSYDKEFDMIEGVIRKEPREAIQKAVKRVS